jgi:hypothetical protein
MNDDSQIELFSRTISQSNLNPFQKSQHFSCTSCQAMTPLEIFQNFNLEIWGLVP